AAHPGRDDADLLLVEPERRGYPVAHAELGLRLRPQRHAAGLRVWLRERRARLQRHRGHALVDEARAPDHLGAGEHVLLRADAAGTLPWAMLPRPRSPAV